MKLLPRLIAKRRPRRALLMGPSNAGKTTLLGTLDLRSELNQSDLNTPLCDLYDLNEPMQKLCQLARQGLVGGSIPIDATNSLRHFVFSARVRNSGFSTTVLEGDYRRAQFNVLDGPGGAVQENLRNTDVEDQQSFAKSTLEYGHFCDSLVVCFDSMQSPAAAAFTNTILQVLDARQSSPLERVVFLLTKAEQLCAIHNISEADLREVNPWPILWQLLGAENVRAIWTRLDVRQTKLACLWVSAYGFLPGGEPNYCDSTQTMRSRGSSAEEINNWRPFQVLDPFIYATGGPTDSVWLYKGSAPC